MKDWQLHLGSDKTNMWKERPLIRKRNKRKNVKRSWLRKKNKQNWPRLSERNNELKFVLLAKRSEKSDVGAVRRAQAVLTVDLRIPVRAAVRDPTRRIPVDQVAVDLLLVIAGHPTHPTAVGRITVGREEVTAAAMIGDEAGNDRMSPLHDRKESHRGRWTEYLEGTGLAVAVHQITDVDQSIACLGVDDRSVGALRIGARAGAIVDVEDLPVVARLHLDAELIAMTDPLAIAGAKKEVDGGEIREMTAVGDLVVHPMMNDEDGETRQSRNET